MKWLDISVKYNYLKFYLVKVVYFYSNLNLFGTPAFLVTTLKGSTLAGAVIFLFFFEQNNSI